MSTSASTADLCGSPATRAQIRRTEARLRERDDVYSVVFVSKEEALEIMKKKYPEEVQSLPMNPFPDVLNVRPVKDGPAEEIAAAARAERGVQHVRTPARADCTG